MDFLKVIKTLAEKLENAGVRYALIGGFAMAMRGSQRATMDIDFILMLNDLNKANLILESLGYLCVFRNENVSHYQSKDKDWGRIDILHAFRGPSLSMLRRVEWIELGNSDLKLPVLQIEDLIGLKLQAIANNPERKSGDWQDILWMLETAKETAAPIHWNLLEDYFSLFKMRNELNELRQSYGTLDRE